MASEPEKWIRFGWEPCYLAEVYIKAVESGVVLPPNKEALMPDTATKPPQHIKAPGRPQKKRIRSAADHNGVTAAGRPLKVHKCSRCHKPGHHYTTCPAPINLDSIDLTKED